ncbi:hypothetical protein N7455_009027 [Penicillium solitum]|uniref:Uncharacterized protein n=1 Tax=Penicillium solitum TaxID=60172 RepID=A0A1V6QWF0_9EURO|nr:uncharacterized protein PENSOL_c033G07569 [Penicillium solitum]KAF4772137.1 hypothetical protein HAV15_004937 [Penicillium sp. str. \
MKEHHRIPLSLKEIMTLQHSEGLTEYEAWRQVVIYYNQERGGHADATTLASTSDEIPLGESVLTSKTAPASSTPATHIRQPPVNAAGESHILSACKPNEYISQQLVRENTERLIASGVATKPCVDSTLDASLFEPTETTDTRQD